MTSFCYLCKCWRYPTWAKGVIALLSLLCVVTAGVFLWTAARQWERMTQAEQRAIAWEKISDGWSKRNIDKQLGTAAR